MDTLNEYFDEYFQNFCMEIVNRHYFIRSASIAEHQSAKLQNTAFHSYSIQNELD
jgi:hypothetical protein